MKRRTIIGAIFIVVAIIFVFVVSPWVNKITTDSMDVIRLSKNVNRGTRITAEHLEVVSVKRDSVPKGVINDANIIIGSYAATELYAGDYLNSKKLAGEANSADDVFADLGDKIAISVPLNSFAGQLSGKLQNGDIVRFYVQTHESDRETYIPGALQWVKIITTTTGGGIDQDQIVENDDGSYEMPSTVTVLVNEAQALQLADLAKDGSMHLSLIYRGTAEKAQEYLKMQDEYFESLANGEVEEDPIFGEDQNNQENNEDNAGDDYVDDNEENVTPFQQAPTKASDNEQNAAR